MTTGSDAQLPENEIAAVPASDARDPQGRGSAAFAELVAIMARLRSLEGCPWDREQDHVSLVPYAIEEAYEVAEAAEAGAPDELAEELGDLLLQVVFHARIAEENGEFAIDDVIGAITAKLMRRHPHVFADTVVRDADEVATNWDAIKQTEKRRDSILDGIPAGQPSMARAAKVLSRARRAGIDVTVPESSDLGDRMLALVAEAGAGGQDAEALLRAALRRLENTVQTAEIAAAPESD